MKQPEVFKKIGGIIQEINEQYEYLQSTADNLNDLELELFVANTHFLTDHAEILRKLNLIKSVPAELPPHVEEPITRTFILPPPPQPFQTPAPVESKATPIEVKPAPVELWPEPVEEKPISIEPKYFEPLVQQKPIAPPFKPEPQKPVQDLIQFEIAKPEDTSAPQIDVQSSAPADSYSFEREEPETIRHELVLDDTHDWDEEEDDAPIDEDEILTTPQYIIEPEEQVTEAEEPIPTNPEPVIDNNPKVQEVQSPQPAPEDNKPLSLNQRMAAKLKEGATATAQTSEPPIQDIKVAINLNDKMLFIKDLFNGYPLSYSEAIEIVNRFKNFEEADRFLKTNYVTKNNWEAKRTTADKFYALLRRRYA
jgi:hypothetical protein